MGGMASGLPVPPAGAGSTGPPTPETLSSDTSPHPPTAGPTAEATKDLEHVSLPPPPAQQAAAAGQPMAQPQGGTEPLKTPRGPSPSTPPPARSATPQGAEWPSAGAGQQQAPGATGAPAASTADAQVALPSHAMEVMQGPGDPNSPGTVARHTGNGGDGHEFEVTGNFHEEDERTVVQLKLKLDVAGHKRTVGFPFVVRPSQDDEPGDTPNEVAEEMIKELGLSLDSSSVIAEIIDIEISKLVPEWTPGSPNVNHLCAPGDGQGGASPLSLSPRSMQKSPAPDAVADAGGAAGEGSGRSPSQAVDPAELSRRLSGEDWAERRRASYAEVVAPSGTESPRVGQEAEDASGGVPSAVPAGMRSGTASGSLTPQQSGTSTPRSIPFSGRDREREGWEGAADGTHPSFEPQTHGMSPKTESHLRSLGLEMQMRESGVNQIQKFDVKMLEELAERQMMDDDMLNEAEFDELEVLRGQHRKEEEELHRTHQAALRKLEDDQAKRRRATWMERRARLKQALGEGYIGDLHAPGSSGTPSGFGVAGPPTTMGGAPSLALDVSTGQVAPETMTTPRGGLAAVFADEKEAHRDHQNQPQPPKPPTPFLGPPTGYGATPSPSVPRNAFVSLNDQEFDQWVSKASGVKTAEERDVANGMGNHAEGAP